LKTCLVFWFVFLGQQEHELLGSALHFIQPTWFTYVFANIEVQFAECILDLAT